ncbi:biorientation of chromosomes in cell division protein 1-like 1 isoform X3 [Ascaphus truei]|uniref:biorientation of chromosomes in cell division protein 1-like 1 isoform X3 n=1 Tax=Ascaphus truei TaxID=8439 RepID=UPI003F59456E
MANLQPGDPKLVSQIVSHLKSQGLFDQFRRDCLADVDTKPAYQNLRQRVDNFVSNHLANHTWSPHLNKNQLRNNIRQQVLKSGMLESGIDRIISQVVDPKINHTFRPQVEKVVQDFLATLNNKEDTNSTFAQNEEKSDLSFSVPGLLPTVGPSTSVASDAMSILETISSLNLEASAARALMETGNHKNSDKVGKKLLAQQGFDAGAEKDRNSEDLQDIEKSASEIAIEVTEPVVKQDDFSDISPMIDDVKNTVDETNDSIPSKDTPDESEEPKFTPADKTDKRNEITDKTDRKEEKKETRTEKKNEHSKNDDGLRVKVEKALKEREDEAESMKQMAVEKNSIKHKTADTLKEECTLDDSDIDAYTDVTVSSVHTSDLSSFEEESEEEAAISDSTEEGEITSDDEEDNADTQSKAKAVTEQNEGKVKSARHSYVHKPYLYSKYYSDSDDELTVEQRRHSVAKAKEERLLRRQMNRERLEEKRKQKAAERTKTLNMKSQGKTSAEYQSSIDMKAKSSSIKEVLKEQKFLEKKVAMSKQKKRDSRTDQNNLKIKCDLIEEDSKDAQKTNELHEKTSLSTKEAKNSVVRSDNNKPSKKCTEPAEESKSDIRSEREHKKKPPLFIDKLQQDNDIRDTRKQVERLDSFSEEQQKQKSGTKLDKNTRKELGDLEMHNAKSIIKKEAKSHRTERERTLSEDRSSSKHRYKTDNVHKASDDLEPQRSKKNIKEDDSLQKYSQSKSSSEERSDRKSKHKSDGKSSTYSKDEKTSASEHTLKTDENARKESSKRDRYQSTDKSRPEHKYKRSLSDSRTHRDSQSTSRQHSTSSQKKSKIYSEDKNEADSTNSDNSKQGDSVHKDRRRIKSCSEERVSSKAKFKSHSKSLKSSDQEIQEQPQKTDKDKTLGEGYTEKRKSKSEEKDSEERNESVIAHASTNLTKESGHKSKHLGDKEKERSRSDNRERFSSKLDKKLYGETPKSTNLKHSHKDLKRKEDGSKLEEKLAKYSDEKKIQERRSSLYRKSDKKQVSEYKGESSKAVITKKPSKLETDNEVINSASEEQVKTATSPVSTEEKEGLGTTNSERPYTIAVKMSVEEAGDEIAELIVPETFLASNYQASNPYFESENTSTNKNNSLKHISNESRLNNVRKDGCTTVPALDSRSSVKTEDNRTKDMHLTTHSAAEHFEDDTMSASCSGNTNAVDVSKEDVINSRITLFHKTVTSSNSNADHNSTDVDIFQNGGDEKPSSEQRDAPLETHAKDSSNFFPVKISSDVKITGSNDGEISTTDTAEESGEHMMDLSNVDERTATKEFKGSKKVVLLDNSELDNLVTGNDVEEDSVVDRAADAMESNSKNVANENISSFDVERKCERLITVTCTENNVESSIMETNVAGNDRIAFVHSELCEHASSSSTVMGRNTNLDCEDSATSSSSVMEKTEKERVRATIICSKGSSENVATSSNCLSSSVDKDNENVMVNFDNGREYTATTSASDIGNFAEEDAEVTMLSDNSTEDATTSSSSYRKNCFENCFLDTSLSSEKSRENTATSSQTTTDTVPEDEDAVGNITLKAATSSSAVIALRTDENNDTHRASSENDQENAATSSYNAEENTGALRVSENIITHAATSSSSVIDSRKELNLEGSLASSEMDNENTAASSSNVMDSSMEDDSGTWLKKSVERENENAASSSSTLNEHENRDFISVEDSKNARATSSTQQNSVINKRCMGFISSGTLKEYPVNSSDIVMDSSTEVSVSISGGVDCGSAASCSSSGRDQSLGEEKDLDQAKDKDNNTASSSSALIIHIKDNSVGPVVPSQNGDEAASSSSIYMDSSTEHSLVKVIYGSENVDATASSSISMNSSTERVDGAFRICPGNSNDNAATSSSNSMDRDAVDININNLNHSTHATTSSSVAMDSSTEEDMDMRFIMNVENRVNAATSSSTLNSITKEQKDGNFTAFPEKGFEMTASSSTIMDSSTTDKGNTIVCPDKGNENAASSSGMMDSGPKNNQTCNVLSNNTAYATTSSSNVMQRSSGEQMDESFTVCFERNSEATAASSTSSSSAMQSSPVNGDNATSSDYLMGSSLGREKVSQTACPDKNEEAASSSGLFAGTRSQEMSTGNSIGSQIVEDATTSSSTERENETVVRGRTNDIGDSEGNESRYIIVEAAVESSFAASVSDAAISGTVEEAAATFIGTRTNDEAGPVMHSDDSVNNILICERTDEKEDTVSSASSEEQKVCSNGSRQNISRVGEGEIDGAVTSAGTEVSESSMTSHNAEVFGHVTYVNREGIVDVSNTLAGCPVEEVAVSHTSSLGINENRVTVANVDNRVTENSESGVFKENTHYETMPSIGEDQEAERPINKVVLEEGEGAVTSTGITEENYGEKISGGIREGTCSGTETEGSGNFISRADTRDCNTIIEDDESAITSTGAKEDEEEGEGFVTSTGTGSEDSSFSIGMEEHSDSVVIHTIGENIGISTEAGKREHVVQTVKATDEGTESVMSHTNETLQNNIRSKCTESSEESTTVISNAFSKKCSVLGTVNISESTVLVSERAEQNTSSSDMEIDVSVPETIAKTYEERCESEPIKTLSDDEITVGLEQDEIARIPASNEESMCISISESSTMNIVSYSAENLDSKKTEADGQDGKNIDSALSKDNGEANQMGVDHTFRIYTIYASLKHEEDSHSVSGLESLSTDIESPAAIPSNEQTGQVNSNSHNLHASIGTNHGTEDVDHIQSDLPEDGNTVPVTGTADTTSTVKDRLEEFSTQKTEEIKPKRPEVDENPNEVLSEIGSAEVLPKEKDVLQDKKEDGGKECGNEREQNSVESLTVISISKENTPDGLPPTLEGALIETPVTKCEEEQKTDAGKEDATFQQHKPDLGEDLVEVAETSQPNDSVQIEKEHETDIGKEDAAFQQHKPDLCGQSDDLAVAEPSHPSDSPSEIEKEQKSDIGKDASFQQHEPDLCSQSELLEVAEPSHPNDSPSEIEQEQKTSIVKDDASVQQHKPDLCCESEDLEVAEPSHPSDSPSEIEKEQKPDIVKEDASFHQHEPDLCCQSEDLEVAERSHPSDSPSEIEKVPKTDIEKDYASFKPHKPDLGEDLVEAAETSQPNDSDQVKKEHETDIGKEDAAFQQHKPDLCGQSDDLAVAEPSHPSDSPSEIEKEQKTEIVKDVSFQQHEPDLCCQSEDLEVVEPSANDTPREIEKEHKTDIGKEDASFQKHKSDLCCQSEDLEVAEPSHPSDSPSEIKKDQSSEEVKRPGGRKRLAKSRDGKIPAEETEMHETPATLYEEEQITDRAEEESLSEQNKPGQSHLSALSEQETEQSETSSSRIEVEKDQSTEETEELTPVKVKRPRGRKSLAKLQEELKSKEDHEKKMQEVSRLNLKTEEECKPKIETEKRKRGRPPKKRNLNIESPVQKKVSEEERPQNVKHQTEDTASKETDTPDLEKTEKHCRKSDTDNAERSVETVHRRGRKSKRSFITSENDGPEPQMKRKKSEGDEKGEDDEDADEETEDDEEEEDDHKGATTRATSRLEAQRKLPHKPTTRAASKRGSIEPSTSKKKHKEKSSPESKSSRTIHMRSKSQQSCGAKRKRESSPPAVPSHSQQTSEETPAKKSKRQ